MTLGGSLGARRGSTVEEYLRAPWEIERDQEIERDNAMLDNLRCVLHAGPDRIVPSGVGRRLAPLWESEAWVGTTDASA